MHCDALLARAREGQRASSDYNYALEGLRSQLYQIHLDLTKLLLKGS